MATKTSGEIENEFVDNLEDSTGRSLVEWMKHLGTAGLSKRNDMVRWLKRTPLAI